MNKFIIVVLHIETGMSFLEFNGDDDNCIVASMSNLV